MDRQIKIGDGDAALFVRVLKLDGTHAVRVLLQIHPPIGKGDQVMIAMSGEEAVSIRDVLNEILGG